MKKIAVIGSGISGLTAAYVLSQKHSVTIFEAGDRVGGHTATIDINHKGKPFAIDTGFIVFNDWTYPNFQKLLQQLNVESQPTEMGFSVSCQKTGIEYSGNNLDTLFAQRRNLFRPDHWRMIRDILRFNKESIVDVQQNPKLAAMTLGEYLKINGYSAVFKDFYLIPMGAAIWSASTDVMEKFPLQFFVRFFKNHGLLSVNDRPQWHVIKGGSREYIKPLIKNFENNIRLNASVTSVIRTSEGVSVSTNVTTEMFDEVVIACHSDQALEMLSDASADERQVLGDIPYQPNEVVLHTDTRLLPANKKTWSSWNYQILNNAQSLAPPALTYNMNILQGINPQESGDTFCVTLNNTQAINPEKILGVYHYSHPVFTLDGINAQSQWERINGHNRTWFCGAYWANGFHEDGVVSALRVAENFGLGL